MFIDDKLVFHTVLFYKILFCTNYINVYSSISSLCPLFAWTLRICTAAQEYWVWEPSARILLCQAFSSDFGNKIGQIWTCLLFTYIFWPHALGSQARCNLLWPLIAMEQKLNCLHACKNGERVWTNKLAEITVGINKIPDWYKHLWFTAW